MLIERSQSSLPLSEFWSSLKMEIDYLRSGLYFPGSKVSLPETEQTLSRVTARPSQTLQRPRGCPGAAGVPARRRGCSRPARRRPRRVLSWARAWPDPGPAGGPGVAGGPASWAGGQAARPLPAAGRPPLPPAKPGWRGRLFATPGARPAPAPQRPGPSSPRYPVGAAPRCHPRAEPGHWFRKPISFPAARLPRETSHVLCYRISHGETVLWGKIPQFIYLSDIEYLVKSKRMRLGNVPLGHHVCSNTVTVLRNTKLLNYAFNLQSPDMEEHQTVGHFFHYRQFFSRLRHLC